MAVKREPNLNRPDQVDDAIPGEKRGRDTDGPSVEETPTVRMRLEDQEIFSPPADEIKKAQHALAEKFTENDDGTRDFEDVDLYILDDWSLDRKTQQEIQEEIIRLESSFEGFKEMLAKEGILEEVTAHVKDKKFLSGDLLYSANTFSKFEAKILAYKKALVRKVEELRQIYRQKKEKAAPQKPTTFLGKVKSFLKW